MKWVLLVVLMGLGSGCASDLELFAGDQSQGSHNEFRLGAGDALGREVYRTYIASLPTIPSSHAPLEAH